MGNVDSGGSCTSMVAESIWEHCILSVQICCEPNTTLKNNVYLIFKIYNGKKGLI